LPDTKAVRVARVCSSVARNAFLLECDATSLGQ